MKHLPPLRQVGEKWPSLVLGTTLLVLGYFLATIDVPLKISFDQLPQDGASRVQARFCAELIEPNVVLSQEQLSQLTKIPIHSDRQQVEQILKQPYCRLSALNIRAGALTEREVYPLAFDPQTSLIVLYEGKNYVGYGFKQL